MAEAGTASPSPGQLSTALIKKLSFPFLQCPAHSLHTFPAELPKVSARDRDWLDQPLTLAESWKPSSRYPYGDKGEDDKLLRAFLGFSMLQLPNKSENGFENKIKLIGVGKLRHCGSEPLGTELPDREPGSCDAEPVETRVKQNLASA